MFFSENVLAAGEFRLQFTQTALQRRFGQFNLISALNSKVLLTASD